MSEKKKNTIEDMKDIIYIIATKYGIEKVVLFGSYARGEEHQNSDIDLLIDKGELKGLFQFSAFKRELEETLQKPVDVVTKRAVSKKFLKNINGKEIILYEK
ncbi:MAG: nucleotidyltransferase domain-containing protein [Oscillospiraceae bacterium]|nr:nucleotidyltransferase domain-containing protein [Oscillospiraceae bacterium]